MGEIQRAFAAGEVSPTLYGRPDVDRWSSALKTCRNWIVEPEGGITVRQGFELKGRIAYTDPDTVALMPFEFGPDDSYVEVFHDDVMNLVRDGAVLRGDKPITVSINHAVSPRAATSSTAHGYATGDIIDIFSGQLGGNQYTITVTGPTGFTLDGTTAGSGTQSAIVRRSTLVSGTASVLSFPVDTDFPAPSARMVQSGDTQFVAAGDRAVLKIVRGATKAGSLSVPRECDFTVSTITGTPPTHTVGTLSLSSGGSGTDTIRYRITATDKDGVESAVLRKTLVTTSAVTGTTTWTINVTGHGLETNDFILITDVVPDSYNQTAYESGDLVRVIRVDADNFTIPGPSTGATIAAAQSIKYHQITASKASLPQPSSSNPVTVTWAAVSGAQFYNVYREFGRVYGYIGSTSEVTFVDYGIIPDTKDTPITGISPFKDPTVFLPDGDYPRAVGLFQERLMLGGFTADIERITGSHVGNFSAFDPGAEDASGLDFGLAGRTVSGIQHLVEIAGRAVVLSDTSEWVLRGGTSGGLTPTAINARADSYYGSSSVIPCVVGTSLIYLQRGDRIVRDAQYDFGQEALASRDLTLWSRHLFKAGIKRMAYQRTDQILWCLLHDGTLTGLTYIPEQNIWGWHRHDIDGRDIADICVVSEDGTDRLYIAALNGSYIDIGRLPTRWESSVVDDHIGFDFALTYNGYYTGKTATLTGGTDWKTTNTLTMTASASTFVSGDVGSDFLLTIGDDEVQVTCTAYTSATVISVQPRSIVPTSLRGVACSSWAKCASTFTGLTHLEGETVGVIADGGREPNDTVSSGSITLSRPFARVQVGIPMVADAVTLDLEATQKDTSLGDFKHVTRVILRVLNSRGLKVGLTEATLEEMYPEYTDVVNAPPSLQSGAREVLMSATHEDSGSVLIRQDQGLPAVILNARTVFNVGEAR